MNPIISFIGWFVTQWWFGLAGFIGLCYGIYKMLTEDNRRKPNR